MFHACIVSTLLCFVYTLSCFYIFSGTNLLTSCHSASCLFSSIFGSRKAENQYSRNWTGQNQKSIFYCGRHEARRGDREVPEDHHTPQARARVDSRLGRVWPLRLPPSLASSPIRSP